ncbi:MAG TPA: hypothetical protein VFH27_16765, partial [Longimicrobiaceae bacterium]|nr:hypothetical protein [Longimicrobiaceae bacterium]
MAAAEWIRPLMLYLPIAAAGGAWALRMPGARLRAGVLLSAAWCLVTLPALHAIAQCAGWWSFPVRGGVFLGMPVEALVGWAVLWGVVLPLALPRIHPLPLLLAAGWLDLMLMPLCAPVLRLGADWWVGEAVALGACLLPALVLGRWTAEGRRLYARAAMQAALSGGLVLWLIPAAAFAQVGGGWGTLLARPLSATLTWAQILAVAALPGLSATQEFATRGGGTPIPYDPPTRRVHGGPYAYVANPMQLSAALTLTLWGGLLGSGWVMLGGAMTVCYSAGLAAWDEDADLSARFGPRWAEYRAAVRPWLPRWRPYRPAHLPPARLYVAAECGPCSEVGAWMTRQGATGLVVVRAEAHPARDLRRITYDAADGGAEQEGVAALSRALEHVHAGWALAGMALRLPRV